MRNKTPLTMIEQVIMLVVFALAAALCLQAFVTADQNSKYYAARDRAVTQTQTAAETLKSCRGDYAQAADLLYGHWDEETLTVFYDENWNISDAPEITYILRITPEEPAQPLLSQATAAVTDADGEQLFSLPISWQTGGAP